MHQPAVDLFGQVVVTWPDIEAWLRHVARLDPASPRAGRYVRDWDVPGKVARAKAEGWFEEVTRPRDPPPGLWWLRFRWG